MLRSTKANALAAIALAILALSTGRSLADGTKIVSDDSQARFIALSVSKSIVLDFPRDVNDILISDPKVANTAVLSKRRVELIGVGLGQTNIYLYDADGRQITAYNVAVLNTSTPAEMERNVSPANVVVFYGGVNGAFFSCSPIICVTTVKPGADEPPGTINIRGAPASVSVGGK